MTKNLKILDLKFIPCPLNVVKCKLALEKLSLNENLIIDLDRGEPEQMVKKTLNEMGYKYLTILEKDKTIKFQVFNEYRK